MSCRLGEYFPKCIRLRKRGDYLDVQRCGRKVQSSAFIGLVLMRDTDRSRLGVTVTKRLGNAAVRNRIKRLVREAFRRGWLHLPDHTDVVVIAKKRAATLDSNLVFDDLAVLGRQVRKLMEQYS